MQKKLDVICIDGVVGVGKTTQCTLISNLLDDLDIHNMRISLSSTDVGKIGEKLDLIRQSLNQDPTLTIICDSSIASKIVLDTINSKSKELMSKEHGANLTSYEYLNKNFNFLNILLSPDNINMCYNRIKKRESIYKSEEVEMRSPDYLKRVASAFDMFDNNILAINLDFKRIKIREDQNMLDIFELIKKEIKESPLVLEHKKSPSEEGL